MNEEDPVAAFRMEAGELIHSLEQALLRLSRDLANQDLIGAVFLGLHTLKGSGAMFGFDALADIAHHCETAIDRVRKGHAPASTELVEVILSTLDHMRALTAGESSGMEANNRDILRRLHTVSGSSSECPDAKVPASPEVIANPDGAGHSLTGSPGNIRVSTETLDALMLKVTELERLHGYLSELACLGIFAPPDQRALDAISGGIERVAVEMRKTMTDLRLVPVDSLFSRFRRLVHDLARKTGKTISLSISGEETAIDRTVAERLADPIMHLIRNACDHGLEIPEERKAAGKPVTGVVMISARQTGAELLITISDDGRGIDADRVRARAEAEGLVEPNTPINDCDLVQLVFRPGFTTAMEVTKLSGRGVGMEVVKRAIESLGSAIDITTSPGQGLTVVLRIPLAVALADETLFQNNGGVCRPKVLARMNSGSHPELAMHGHRLAAPNDNAEFSSEPESKTRQSDVAA